MALQNGPPEPFQKDQRQICKSHVKGWAKNFWKGVLIHGVSNWATGTFSESPLTTNLPIVSEGVFGPMHLFKRILLFQLEQMGMISTPVQLEDFASPSAQSCNLIS